jgi:two-component system chemotaxis sensor kinase CheA
VSNTGPSFFDQFLNDYFAESEDHLTSARNTMLSIESTGVNKGVESNVLDELLRNFHSLKGLSAMVGLEEATQLAHHIEAYLKELKRPDTVISADAMEQVLAGITAMEQVLEAKRRSEPTPDIGMVLLQLEGVAEEVRATSGPIAKSEACVWRFVFKSSAELARQGLTVGSVREQLRKIGEVLNASPKVLNGGQIAFEFTVSSNAPESAFENLRLHGIEYSRVSEDSLVAQPSKR